MLDSNVARLVSRDEQADLLAHARALPEVPTCASGLCCRAHVSR
jgi:hypothetical protein